MAGGLISTDIGYQQSALSGMQRLSAQEQQRQEQNQAMQAQQTSTEVSAGMGAASLIASIAMFVTS